MKTAILISGAYRPESVKLHVVLNELSEAFPDTDVYFHTWDEYKHLVPSYLNVESCPEPIINYDTMLDPDVGMGIGRRYDFLRQQLKNYDAGEKVTVRKARLEKFLGTRQFGTKQILGHADLYEKVKKLNKGYDRFIRTRWDVCIQKNVDFTPFLEQSETGPIGFQFPVGNQPYPDFDSPAPRRVTLSGDQFLSDHMIIHHKDHFDPELVYILHKNKQLLPGEWGWYQTMVKPYKNIFKVYQNGAGIYRNYEKKRKDK